MILLSLTTSLACSPEAEPPYWLYPPDTPWDEPAVVPVGTPIVLSTQWADPDAWIDQLAVTTSAGTPLEATVERIPDVPRAVYVHVVDPPVDLPVDGTVLVGPGPFDEPIAEVRFSSAASLPPPPDWGDATIRFRRGDSMCDDGVFWLEVEPRLEDVWYEVVAEDGESWFDDHVAVGSRSRRPAGAFQVTPVDAYGQRGETREVRFRRPGGCTTAWSTPAIGSLFQRRR